MKMLIHNISLQALVNLFLLRSRGPEYSLHWRVRRGEDGEHEESDPVPGLCRGLQAEDKQPPSGLGKICSFLSYVWV